MIQKPLCIYHGNCADGFGSAWVVREYFGRTQNKDVDFHAGVYMNAPPPLYKGQIVILVDFSYKREVLLEMAKGAEAVLVIDHHKSAIEDLKADGCYIINMNGYLGKLSYDRFLTNVALDHVEGGPRIYTVFDLNRSGATLTWDFFFPDEIARPRLLEHIEDRDLWRFKLSGTREIQANLFSYPYDFQTWDVLMQRDPIELIKEGTAIERKHFKDINELILVTKRRMRIAGHNVPVANLPYIFSSDAGHIMAKDEPFAACYTDTPSGRVFSLRSNGDQSVDVSAIASLFGGGGHKAAAGFRVSFEKAREFEV